MRSHSFWLEFLLVVFGLLLGNGVALIETYEMSVFIPSAYCQEELLPLVAVGDGGGRGGGGRFGGILISCFPSMARQICNLLSASRYRFHKRYTTMNVTIISGTITASTIATGFQLKVCLAGFLIVEVVAGKVIVVLTDDLIDCLVLPMVFVFMVLVVMDSLVLFSVSKTVDAAVNDECTAADKRLLESVDTDCAMVDCKLFCDVIVALLP